MRHAIIKTCHEHQINTNGICEQSTLHGSRQNFEITAIQNEVFYNV